ncbi:glutaminase [Paremcibacter congregatus]|uniref:Glutaminase n=1 Tax=Paremcibacter congregatus TaxID=2043170 RepID=A0A2G4YUZ2_9PROT|nr:glutaminase [Paremcibacter congregatus]PHZ86148.1 glutaminase [Paremcibacter congregatus]QDE27113.1 glutaminase [Paremcibacter congregatus]|tara:strand:- start:4123 stop:5037 length:915 start_codon:yes stop_codon:yes gene_type:complete
MNYQAVLNYISEFIQPEFGKGKVADYIPSLANIPPTKFGMAIHMVDGQTYKVGDAEENFSIQSISKLFVLQLVMRHMGDMVWTKVGKEPSGDPFNSLVLLEHENGIPRNPFINAGALATTDMLMSTTQDASLLIRNYLKFISMNPAIESDPLVAQSELETSHVNHALAHLMKSYGVIENDVGALIEVYCQHCAISMNCVDLAAAILPLADKGYSAVCGETILPERNAKRLNAVMLTCGTYDSVGSFAYRVGLPAKSGVGGGIVAVVPGKMSIAVWSPELDKFGNSYVGTAALEQFTSLTHCSIF